MNDLQNKMYLIGGVLFLSGLVEAVVMDPVQTNPAGADSQSRKGTISLKCDQI